MKINIEESWKAALTDEFSKPYFQNLTTFVRHEYSTQIVYPKGHDIFAAFDNCPFDKVKAVMLGQDPYHGVGQAHGLCFSVNSGVKIPPSLQNIFKEIQNDLGIAPPSDGNLLRWAEQGVLMLNATLTVRASSPGSHSGKGWEEFTDAVVRLLSEQKNNLVFLLWGAYAQKKGEIINQTNHKVLQAAHPSPFSVHKGFFGCKHFSKTNDYLVSKGLEPIIW